MLKKKYSQQSIVVGLDSINWVTPKCRAQRVLGTVDSSWVVEQSSASAKRIKCSGVLGVVAHY